jgi:hypothetical protein
VLGAALLIAGAMPARAAGGAARIAELAAGADRLFALAGNRVVWFDADGRELGRCPRFETSPAERRRAAAPAALDADEVLRLAGLPDDDPDSSEAEDVLDDEGLTPRRRARPTAPEPPVLARAIAASPASDDVWIATSAGLYRGRGRSCARLALAGRDAVAIAAGGDAVAVATEDLLWRSAAGGTFRIAAGLPARPRALAVVDGDHTLVATDDAIIEIGPFGIARPVLDRGGDALAVCGGVALALAGDGAWTWAGDAAPERTGERPPVRAVACGDGGGARFIAAGAGVYASPDGAAWREQRALFPQSVGAIATIAGRIWLAVDGDLVPLGGSPPSRRRPGRFEAPLPALPALPTLPTHRLLEPLVPWPQLTLVLAGQRTPLREGWSLVVLLSFRLGRAAAAGADRRQLAAELVRLDAALAAEESDVATATNDDPSRNARLRALRTEREALR